jgi:ribosomal protein S18 acetylase RimI-like enzyme
VSRPIHGPLHSSHRAQVEALLAATAVFSEEEIAVALEVFEDALKTQSDYELIGAFNDAGGLLGYACYGQTPATDRTYDLYWIAVHPDTHGSGVGSALMEEVERRLAARSARMIVVETSAKENYESTRRFYDHLGYSETARLSDFYAPGDARVLLTKKLQQASGPAAA